MPALKNTQHEKFVQELLKGSSQADAYMAAGYSAKSVAVASAAANRLLKDVSVAARLRELQDKIEERAIVDRKWVLERLVENANRAMMAVAVKDKEGKETGEYTYEGSVANRALELIGKEFGMFVDRKEVGKPGDFSEYTDEQLDQIIREELPAVASETVKNLRGAGKTRH